jgi:hypothetical protein
MMGAEITSETSVNFCQTTRCYNPYDSHLPTSQRENLKFYLGGNTLRSENHKLINSIWNNEELPEQLEESIVRIHNRSDKTDCINYR